MMRKYIIAIFLFLGIMGTSSADTVYRYFDYGEDSEVNANNLNGNFNNIITVINGALTNVNTKSGYSFFEVLSSLPVAGTQGRIVYNTTEDTINADNGTAWVTAPTYAGTAAQGELLYFDGTNWARLAVGTSGQFLQTKGTANPVYSKVDLADTTEITGTLAETNGGTGVTSGVMIEGDSAGGVLSGTYPNPSLGAGKAGLYYEPDSCCVLALAGFSRYPATAATFKDSSVYGNDFAVVGAPPAAAGIVSKTCMDLESGPDYLQQVAASADLGDCDDITLEFWIKTDTAAQGEAKALFDNRLGTWYVALANGTGIITATLEVGTGAASVTATTGITDTAKWYYIVLTYDTSSHNLVLYVNGVEEDTDDSKTGDVDAAQNDDFSIGANQDGSSDFNGKLDGIRILRREIFVAEVLARYNTFK